MTRARKPELVVHALREPWRRRRDVDGCVGLSGDQAGKAPHVTCADIGNQVQPTIAARGLDNRTKDLRIGHTAMRNSATAPQLRGRDAQYGGLAQPKRLLAIGLEYLTPPAADDDDVVIACEQERAVLKPNVARRREERDFRMVLEQHGWCTIQSGGNALAESVGGRERPLALQQALREVARPLQLRAAKAHR